MSQADAVHAGRAVHAVRADLDTVTATVGRAFADDPQMRWLFAGLDEEATVAAIGGFVGAAVEPYFNMGHLYVTAGGKGAGLWAPPDRDPFGDPDPDPLVALLEPVIGADAEYRVGQFFRTHEYRPEVPHFYLGVLAVDPERQGRGLGAALIEPGTEAADRGGFVAHLESSNPRNVSLYLRHGFDPVAEYRPGDEPDGPLMTIMTRQPR